MLSGDGKKINIGGNCLTGHLRAEGGGTAETLSLQLAHTGQGRRGVAFSFDKGQPDTWPQLVLRLMTGSGE